METTVEFYDSLITSKLLTEEQVKQFQETLPPKVLEYSVADLANELIQRKLITSYQYSILMQGDFESLRFGEYILLEAVEETESGDTYRAAHSTTGEIVWIKKFAPFTYEPNQESHAEFVSMMQRVAQLDHPHIVKVLDVGGTIEQPDVLMEAVDGENMSWYISRYGAMSIEDGLVSIHQIASGLAYAHEHQIRHYNIQPSSFFLDTESNLRILDLGLGELRHRYSPLERFQKPKSDSDEGMIEDLLPGNIEYMAPEVMYDPENADHRSDIYSLGCLLYYFLSGSTPYQTTNPINIVQNHLQKPIPKMAGLVQGLPMGIQAILNRMLAKRRSDRYQSMNEVMQDIEHLLERMEATGGEELDPEDMKDEDFLLAEQDLKTEQTLLDKTPFELPAWVKYHWWILVTPNQILISALLYVGAIILLWLLPFGLTFKNAFFAAMIVPLVVNICWVLNTMEPTVSASVVIGLVAGGVAGGAIWMTYLRDSGAKSIAGLVWVFTEATGIPMEPVIMTGMLGAVIGGMVSLGIASFGKSKG